MSRIDCFELNLKHLYLEQVLIEDDGLPLFYVCRDQNDLRYIVSLVNKKTNKYLIAETKTEWIIDLLEQRMTMQEIMLKSSFVWEIIADEDADFSKDKIRTIPCNQIKQQDLAKNDSYYKICTKQEAKYLKKLKRRG